MVRDKLRALMERLDVSAADVADAAGYDRSNVSRLLTGRRIPQRDGASIRRLTSALIALANEKGLGPTLCEAIGADGGTDDERLRERLTAWLYDGMQNARRKTSAKTAAPYRDFGEKLSAAMGLAGLSNARLGKRINVDDSLVSRFRGGQRSPRSNPTTVNAICATLWRGIRERNQTEELAALMKLVPQALADEDAAVSRLREWLFDGEREETAPVVERLVENIDLFSADGQPRLPSFAQAADGQTLDDDAAVYLGAEGLQKAVVRFLGNAVRRGAGELWLYSDQPIDWMVDDPAFFAKWAALMLACVKSGVRIRVIHNVDRDLSEMIDAITGWLPLYMSGMIESYYCKKQRGRRFFHTLFYCPGYACVEGSGVAVPEETGAVYRYDTDPALLEIHRRRFESLFHESRRLVRIVPGTDAGRSFDAANGATVMDTALPLGTMPKALLLGMLERQGANERTRRQALSVWESRRQELERALKAGTVCECAPLAADPSQAPPTSSDVPGLPERYTPAEYAAHLRAIAALENECPSYRFYPLSGVPFTNTRIAVDGASVAVSRLKAPKVTFLITHPAMRDAFAAYFEAVRRRCRLDKDAVFTADAVKTRLKRQLGQS
ncbi:MAG: helix-turn-helix domain-containing protein [Acutalibacteraceae bacterium]